MKGPSALFVALALALATLLILEPTANALVHRLTPTLTRRPLQSSPAFKSPSKDRMAPLDRLASHHGLDLTTVQQRLQGQQQKTTSGNSCGSSGGSRVNIGVEYGYQLTAEMNIGSPDQGPFELELSFDAQQPYVLKKGAKYDDGSKVQGVEEFNSKTSNTSIQQNAAFSSYFPYLAGSVVTDVLQLGPLSANQSVQVTKKVNTTFNDYGVDGMLGLAVSPARDGSSFVEQVASQLDSPVLTLYAKQDLATFYTDDDDETGQGVLSFGDRVPEICDTTWTVMKSYLNKYVSWPVVDTVAVTGPADSNGCGGKVTANITVLFYNAFTPIWCSVQVQELFVRASGARWSWDANWWVVDDASKAVSVKFQTANGGVIEVTPNDYLLEFDGTQFLYTYGDYDQTIYADWDFLVLGQTFLNNHCLSMDMLSGEWSLAGVKSPSEVDVELNFGSSSSSSSSSESDRASHYANRKH